MAPATRLSLLLPLRHLAVTAAATASAARASASPSSSLTARAFAIRALHSNSAKPANVVPVYGTGPPPEPPQPTIDYYGPEHRIARRKRQAELLRQATGLSPSSSYRGKTVRKRFWKDVHVREVNGAYEIHLDTRPLRHPHTKSVIRLPLSKPNLAHSLAVEWDSLLSAQHATKQHLIPLTALTCRALDIAADDASPAGPTIRPQVISLLLRYLDTDSLLCWVPRPGALNVSEAPEEEGKENNGQPTCLHDLQEQTYQRVTGYLTSRLWPGTEIVPVLDGASILPRHQPPGTREVVKGWIAGLSAFELAGLERATLAGKSLLAAARLVAEWSEESPFRWQGIVNASQEDAEFFGVEECAKAVNLEVDWQTRNWGEVEDTHDVEKEELRRQLASVVLLVSGTGRS